MRRNSITVLTALGLAVTASGAEAKLDIYVDKSRQQLSVIQDGMLLYVWPVSTGTDRHSTPNGVYAPERLERSWFSKAYYNIAMPHAIFFHNGYAIHGSYEIDKLGGPASHGCVRLHPRAAAMLFSMVEQEGPDQTTIYVGGDANRMPPQYRDVEEPPPPGWRRDDGMARGPYLPPQPVPIPPRRPGADRFPDSTAPYPPPRSAQRTPPYYPEQQYSGPQAGGQGVYGPAPDGGSYYEPDRYGDGAGDPRGYRGAPYGAGDRYADAQADSYGPYDDDRYTERRGAPPGPPAGYYNADPYAGGRSGPARPAAPPPYYYPPDRRSDRQTGYPQERRLPPRDAAADRRADGPERRYGERLTMRNYSSPAIRAPEPDGEAAVNRSPRKKARPVAAGPKPDPYVYPGPRPGLYPGPRRSDDPADRRVFTGETEQGVALRPPAAPPPMPAAASLPAVPPLPPPAVRVAPPEQPPQAQLPPEIGYKVLPRSYWSGASWRWRIKRDENGFPHDDQ